MRVNVRTSASTVSTVPGLSGVRIVDMPDLGNFDSVSSVVGEKRGSGRFSAFALGAFSVSTSDDTAAIQAAINAAAGRGALRFPAGTYLVSTKLTVPSNSHLIVESGATIRIADGANCDCFTLPYIPGTPTTNVLIELYGTLDGNRANNTTHGGGITTDGAGYGIPNLCSNIYVQGNRQGLIRNFHDWGINITCCSNGEVSGITVDSCGHSTQFAGNAGVYSSNVGFSDCIVSNIADLGLVLYGGVQKGFIRNCEVFGCTSGGAFIFSDNGQPLANSDCEIVGCELHDNSNYGAFIGSNATPIFTIHRNCIISGNHIYANANAGVHINSCDGLLFEGNYVHDNISTGAVFVDLNAYGDVTVGLQASRVSIVGNTIMNPQVGRTDGNGYGIALDSPDYLVIEDNRVGDYQTTQSMTAAIGGNWGLRGLSVGNYYGPRINASGYFPADISYYSPNSVMGANHDAVAQMTSGVVPAQAQQVFVGGSFPSQAITGVVSGRGLSVGWNKDLAPGTHLPGLGEVDLFVGDGLGGPGGFNIWQVAALRISSGTYNAGTGAVSLTTRMPHTLAAGSQFKLRGTNGTTSTGAANLPQLDGAHTATAGTAGSTLNFTASMGLDVLTITGGSMVFSGDLEAGVVNTAVGVSGSLLANDGYGNTRLGGALVHGAMQTWGTLANAGTVTVNASTSMVLVRNASSIAAAIIVLPSPLNLQFSAGAELELNFQNPVGALTWSGATIVNAPTAVAQAGASVNFINSGTAWLRRIAI